MAIDKAIADPVTDPAAVIVMVAMVRDEPQRDGMVTTAQVHPAEVDNYRMGDWVIASE